MNKCAIGIDIGGTNTKIGIVDLSGNIHYRQTISTSDFDEFEDFFRAMAETVRAGMEQLSPNSSYEGIGIGAANGNYQTGSIEGATNLKWKTALPLSKLFKEEFQLPCLLTNDANAAALGEMMYGNAKGMKNFIVITLGTGLGSGIVSHGTLVSGHHGIAGELGHISVDPAGRYCNCGQRGCLETYVSATGICRTVYELLATHIDESEMRSVSFNDINALMIEKAAHRGDPVALAAFEYTGRILGTKLADTVLHTDPEAILLFGGLSLAGDLIIRPTVHHMEKNLMPLFKGKVKILLSGLQNQTSPIFGAASLVWDHLKKKDKL